jgi:hypothetical protein
MSNYKNISLVATGVLVKAGVVRVSSIQLGNAAAATRFVKLYDKATAPTVGTDIPIATFFLPIGGALDIQFASGAAGGSLYFALGLGIAATQLVADADATAPAANDVMVNVIYA